MPARTALRRLRTVIAASLVGGVTATAQGRVDSLDTVTVVASRTRLGDAARAVEVITRADIDRSSARNISELLAARLGVDVYGRSAAQADISLRGSTAEQTLVLVDGIRASDAQSAHYALDLAVPLDAVVRVEILRGAGSALYGPDAVGGVINIVTRGDGGGGEVRTRAGAFGTVGGAAALGTQRGRYAMHGAAEYEKSDGHRAGTDFRIGQARATLSGPVGVGRMESHLGVGVRDFGANAFYGPYNSTERTGTVTADARWTAAVGDWALSATAGTRRHTDRFTLVRDKPSIYENLHTNWQTTGEVVARTSVTGATLAAGVSADNAQLTSARLGSHAEWRGAAFAELSAGSIASPTVNLGVRGDRSSIYGAFVSPAVAVAVPVGRALRLRASTSRGFRAPTWTERYYTDPSNQGNPDLEPERFWSSDVGARVGRTGSIVVDVAAFARNAEHLIDWVRPAGSPPGVRWAASNLGDARYRGVEASLAFPSWHRVQSTLTATGLTFDAALGAGLAGKYALRPMTRQIVARSTYTPWESLRATVELVEARRAKEGGYLTGNVRVDWRRRRLGVTLDLTNLTNASWLDASGVEVVRRAAYVGVALR